MQAVSHERMENDQCKPRHQNCAGGTKKPRTRAPLPEATAIVKNSSTFTAPELAETLIKATIGCGDINNGRTLNRLRQVLRNGGNEQESESYRKLTDYLEQLKATSGGTITDCQVNCVHVGVMRGLRVIGWLWSKLFERSSFSNGDLTKKKFVCVCVQWFSLVHWFTVPGS